MVGILNSVYADVEVSKWSLADAVVVAPYLFMLVYDITPFLDEVSPCSTILINLLPVCSFRRPRTKMFDLLRSYMPARQISMNNPTSPSLELHPILNSPIKFPYSFHPTTPPADLTTHIKHRKH